MKKVILIFIAVLFCNMTNSQVGIGNTDPKATLHISGKPTDNTVVDGVILPKLTGNELKAKDLIYTADQLGAMVYVTAAASPTTSKTANVTAAGYYYYDGSVWLKSNSNLQVGYKIIAAAYPTTPSKGDIVFTTSNGTVAGTKYRIETYDGTSWVNDKGVYPYIVTLAYAIGDIVNKDDFLYESNGAIPANTVFAIGTTGATWKQIVASAVPNWTLAGTFQSVGWGAITTPPTFTGTTFGKNAVYFKKIGAKTHQVEVAIEITNTSGTAGNGDYLFTLPNGLSFDQTILSQVGYTGTSYEYAISEALASSGGGIRRSDPVFYYLRIVPYDATRYRVFTHRDNGGYNFFSSYHFQITSGTMAVKWGFTFQSL
jgi:hypothetical protein